MFQHREMKASHSRSMLKLCKEHCQLELEVKSRHHEHIYDVLAKLMEANHSGHAKTLDEIHDREVKELKNRMDAKSRDHMKQLGKKHKDKQELSRSVSFGNVTAFHPTTPHVLPSDQFYVPFR